MNDPASCEDSFFSVLAECIVFISQTRRKRDMTQYDRFVCDEFHQAYFYYCCRSMITSPTVVLSGQEQRQGSKR